jgi:hypothetical protein
MFPSAPEVEVFAPTTLFTGRQVTVEIVITANEATKIEYVDARLTGHQGWTIGSGKSEVTERGRYPELYARLREEGELPAGTSRYRATFELPRGMPPSHALAPAWAHVELFVRVSIPWWPDGKYKFVLPVRVPPPPDVTRIPFAIRSSAAADDPRIEVSLASTRLIAGETVVGSCAIFHLDDRKPREVELTLVPSFKLHRGRRHRERRGPTLGITVTIPPGGAGTSVPFRFRLPDDITPSFSTVTHDLSWWLVAKSGSFFGKKVEVSVPLEICDASTAALTEKLSVAPRLSDERVARAFEDFARQDGWRTVTEDNDLVDGTQLVIERDAGDATLRISYVYLGEAGTFVFTSVRPPSLGLGLSVKPSSRIAQLLSSDVEIDLAEWDRTHHVVARSPAQATPFLRAVVPAVQAGEAVLGPLRSWSDDELVFSRTVAGIELASLVKAKDALEQLAAALASAAIAPPPGVDVDLDAWKSLAQRYGGRVTPGDLTIDGTLDQLPVEVVLEFAGERAQRIRAYVGDPLRTANSDPLSEQERGEWPADFAELQLVDGVASAMLPIAALGNTAVIDVSRVRELVVALRGLLARRDPSGGPFR